MVVLLWLHGCNQTGSQNDPSSFSQKSQHSTDIASRVIYSLYLPTDIVQLFEETGTGFDPGLLIPPERIPLYEEQDQLALLLGALGVDLNYCNLFGRELEASEIYHQATLLCDRLHLPEEIFDKYHSELEHYLDMPDSLTNLIDRIYTEIDSHFRSHDQEILAIFSLLGGWVEALYIGVGIYTDRSVTEMGDRILQQKYSLNSLYGLLANHQESLSVRRYMHPLNNLKKAYEQVDIRYAKNGFKMNSQEQEFRATLSRINYHPETLDEICRLIQNLRNEIMLYR